MDTKRCTRCKREKPFEEFSSREGTKTGRTAACKQCIRDNFRKTYNIRVHMDDYVIQKDPFTKYCNNLLA